MARRRCTDRPLRRSRPAPPRPQRHQPAGHSGPPALADRLRPRRPRRRPGRPGADARPTDPVAGEAGNRSRLTAGPVRAEIRPPTVELINGAEPKACWRPLAGEERPDRFASKLPPTGGSGEMLPSSVGGRLRAKGGPTGSRASSLQQSKRARRRTEGLLEAACGRRVADPVREQAPSNSRSEHGAEPKACWRPLAGKERPDRFASKLPPTGGSGEMLPSSDGGRLRAKGGP